MAESHLISQLTKLIETQYKEKAVLAHQLAQLEQQKANVDEKILNFERTLTLIDPDFDLRKIKTQFNASQLIKRRLFQQDLKWLISKVLRQDNRWKNLYWITSDVMELDDRTKCSASVTREHELAVIRILRDLYKKGIVERQEVELHKRTIKRGFFRRSEWRLKPLVQE